MINLDYQEDVCGEELQEGITIGYGNFGTYRATCENCSFVCVYWECACELTHECNEEEN